MAEQPSEKPEAGPAAGAASGPPKPTASSGAESPRTAREPDFDDDVQETTHLSPPARQPTPKRVSFQEEVEEVGPAPPPKPPRPASPRAQAEATLQEAFPDIEPKVIRAVLLASRGQVEPAFNALLSMSDPSFVQEPAAPPPRVSSQRRPQAQLSQLEADEAYARRLAEQYNTGPQQEQESAYSGYGSRLRGDPPIARQQRKQTGLNPNELHEDRDYSFIKDDLPVIRQQIDKTFKDATTTVNSWISNFQKRLDGDSDEETIPPRRSSAQPQRQDFGPSQGSQLHGIRSFAEARRRSGDHGRDGRGYDADPQLLSDDFGHRLELRDDEAPPPRPPRPLANPDLFAASAGNTPARTSTDSAGGVRDRGPRQPSPAGAASAGAAKHGKWQPLSSVEPKPVPGDNDPFSLGDSDEEPDTKKDAKVEEAKKDVAKEDETPEAAKTETKTTTS